MSPTGETQTPSIVYDDNESRFYGSGVIVSEGKKGEYKGTIERVLKSSFGDLVYDVRPDGISSTFKVPAEETSIVSLIRLTTQAEGKA